MKNLDLSWLRKFASKKLGAFVTATLVILFSQDMGLPQEVVTTVAQTAAVYIFGEVAVDVVRALVPVLLNLVQRKGGAQA